MISYEVTTTARADIAEAYAHYLRSEHIPDLLATGCFVGARLGRAGAARFRTWYDAPDLAALDRYFAEHAGRLRAHVKARFPDGLELERESWELLERWGDGR
jgi:hypothetical protein